MGIKNNSDLPIHNRLNPRRQGLPPVYRRVVVGLVVFVVFLTLVGVGKRSNIIPELDVPGIDVQIEDNHLEVSYDEVEDNPPKVWGVSAEGVREIGAVGGAAGATDGTSGSTDGTSGSNGPGSGPADFEYYDLNDYKGSADGLAQKDVVLFLMPLRNAENVLPMAFQNLMNLTYDHSLIDIAFLVSDCSEGDKTLEKVFDYSVALQNNTLVEKLQKEEEVKARHKKGSADLYQLYMDQDYINNVKNSYNPKFFHDEYRKPFRSVSIFQKDFGQIIGQGFSDRHAVKVQGIRRKLMGRARNWLTANALKPYHSWVYWRDVDIETCPGSVIQDLMKHDYDVMVPNVWRPLPSFLGNEQPYDLNSWIESEPALELAKKLHEDDVIVEGYAEYPTYRVHLAYIREKNGNPNEAIDMDGVGGVSILARAQLFRQGVNFPAFTFLNHAETEAFGKMAKTMGSKVGGLPHYTIWHIYEPSEDDLMKIAKMERKKRRQKHTKNV